MILTLIILLLVGVIAFFHYVQGLFSATLSALFTVIAAILAVSYHETVVNNLLKGKMGDQAHAMVLCVLFAVIYIVLRLIFDSAVPGNVRFPTLVDKIGSAVMGIIAGIFATGIFALAAQSLPFGPSVGMYSRYPLKDKQGVVIPTERQSVDSVVNEELAQDTFDPAQEKSLLIPVDDIVLAAVQHASDGSALAGAQTFSSIHPDYPQELFGNRLGIQVGARRMAMNLGGTESVQVLGVYSVSALPTSDPEFSQLRKDHKFPPIMSPKPDQLLLVVRVQVDHTAADDADSLFRFSTGSVRLVANGKNYYPVGTVDNANLLYVQKPDDFIILDLKTNSQSGFDAAFLVDKNDVIAGGSHGPVAANNAATPTINDGIFIEVKRLAQIDLSGKTLDSAYSASPAVAVLRKKLSLDQGHKAPAAVPANSTAAPSNRQSSAPSTKFPLAVKSLKMAAPLPNKIGVTTTDVNAENVTVAGGTVSLKDSKLAIVSIDPTDTLEKLATGDNPLNELYVPAGKQVVQITGAKPGADPWDWTALVGSLELIDAGGTHYSANGFSTVVKDGDKSGLLMRYDADKPASPPTAAAGKPAAITYFFVVPSGSELKQVSANGQQAPIEFTVR